MKRIFVIFLILLLTTGCAGQKTPKETDPIVTTLPTVAGLYLPDSDLEQQTDGAVLVYPLQETAYTGLAFMGEKLLLISDSGELTLLSGEQGVPVATVETDKGLSSESIGFSTAQTGIAYYSQQNNAVVLLNPMLQQTKQIELPAEVQQTPVVSLTQNEIYYCIGEEILAQDISSGITRRVKQQSCQSQRLLGSYFDDTLLACEVTDAEGQIQMLYISAETGQTMNRDAGLICLDTHKDRFFTQRMDGMVLQQIVGTLDGDCQSLQIPEAYGTLYGALPQNGMLTCLETQDGQLLSFYDLGSGQKTAEVCLTGVETPVSVLVEEAYIWILASESDTGKQVLYRWDNEKSKVNEDGSYLKPLYTAQYPDTDGLALCQEHVDSYNSQYGVKIAIFEDALAYAGDYEVTPEYQPAAITNMLNQLEGIFTELPEGFLRTTLGSGVLRIGLVRSIEGNADNASFWQDGDYHILVTPQLDFSQAFLRGLGHAIDSCILGNSRAYDDWNTLNPNGFSYGMECDSEYFEGENRYFTDEFATQSIPEDRSRLFAAAMTPDSGEIFASDGMQAKLLCMCKGIREAYELEEVAEKLPWEQHLETALYEEAIE